ncbi:Auxin-induced protein 15A [Cardamine amara subsp. amara]|uniref:Auxin-induced protein 15A n=1 Tax=Cardamine amara subsp. amara TaxID=228776 RepID=A0ABD1AFW5_CARAN
MDENNATKLTGIKQIVRLKEILQKWQSVTIGSKSDDSELGGMKHAAIISPVINKRLLDLKTCDSDEETTGHCPEPPPDVPEGYLAVYVGPELRRFIIPTNFLSHSLFKVLLEKAEEEYGFDHSGALTIPCEVETFKFLLKCIENHPKDYTSAGDSIETEE